MIAEADFVNYFHKLMNDTFCAKAIEIVRKRINLDLIDETGL